MTLIAHAGHWLPQLLYLAPVIVLLGGVLLGKWRNRGSGSKDE